LNTSLPNDRLLEKIAGGQFIEPVKSPKIVAEPVEFMGSQSEYTYKEVSRSS
jgi:hypothetical protein